MNSTALSPRPAGGALVASSGNSTGAWPSVFTVATAAASSVSPALLLVHRDLSRALQLPVLERALEEWQAHFATLERIVASIETALPRWRTLLTAQAAINEQQRREEEEETAQAEAEAATLQQQQPLNAAHPSVDDPFFSSPPLSGASASAFCSTGSRSSSAHAAAALERVGVLACLPHNHLATLARAQGNKLELAIKLLAGVHVEICNSFAQLSTLLEAAQEVFELHKRHFTPAQLALWCSSASVVPAAAAIANSGNNLPTSGSKAAAGKKLTPASSSKNSKGKEGPSSDANASAAASASARPAGNSVTNFVRGVRQMEALLCAQFDRHSLAWNAWHSTLEQASKPRDIAQSFELKRGQPSPSPFPSPEQGADGTASAVTAPAPFVLLLAGWVAVDHEELLSRWRLGHDDYAATQRALQDTLHRLQGRTPRILTAASTWATTTTTTGDDTARNTNEDR